MEKRVNPRLRLEGESDGKARRKGVEVVDLSSTGACIRTQKPYDPGKVINLDLNLADAGEEVSFLAKVCWSRPERSAYLVGLEFVK